MPKHYSSQILNFRLQTIYPLFQNCPYIDFERSIHPMKLNLMWLMVKSTKMSSCLAKSFLCRSKILSLNLKIPFPILGFTVKPGRRAIWDAVNISEETVCLGLLTVEEMLVQQMGYIQTWVRRTPTHNSSKYDHATILNLSVNRNLVRTEMYCWLGICTDDIQRKASNACMFILNSHVSLWETGYHTMFMQHRKIAQRICSINGRQFCFVQVKILSAVVQIAFLVIVLTELRLFNNKMKTEIEGPLLSETKYWLQF